MAVPGPINRASSGGTNELIRKGAVLCRGIDDVLEELEGICSVMIPEVDSAPKPEVKSKPAPPKMDEKEQQIWNLLESGAKQADALAQELNLDASQLSVTLTMMEMKKIIRRLPGNRYEQT